MTTDLFPICDQVLGAGINGVCQGILVSALVAVGLRVLGGTNAATRHAVWLATLLLVAGLIPANLFLSSWSGFAARATGTPNAMESKSLLVPARSLPNLGFPAGAALSTSPSEPLTRAEPVPSCTDPAFSFSSTNQGTVATPDGAGDNSGDTPAAVLTAGAETQPGPARSRTTSATAASMAIPPSPPLISKLLGASSEALVQTASLPPFASVALVALWFSVATARLIVLFCHVAKMQNLKRSSSPASDRLEKHFEGICANLALRRRVLLKLSKMQNSPVVLGFFHPVILLPSEDEVRGERETDQILRHELAHLCRYDDWANLCQQFLQAVFCFHPAISWISRQLSLEREIACDDCALRQGSGARAYALLLAEFASRIQKRPPLLAPGVFINHSQLQQRINMILNTHRNTSPALSKTRLGFITSAAAILAAFAVYSGPRLVLAQTPGPAQSDSPLPPVRGNPAATDLRPAVSPAPALAPLPEPSNPAENRGLPPGGTYPANGAPPLILPPTAPPPPVGALPPTPVAAQPWVPGQPPVGYSQPPYGRIEGSLEARLDRLEQMVRSLVEHQQTRMGDVPRYNGSASQRFGNDDYRKLDDLKEQAVREAELARDQELRAGMEAERALKAAQDRRLKGVPKGNQDKHLEALRKAREDLGRRMQSIDREIEQLERARHQMQGEPKAPDEADPLSQPGK